MESTSSFPQKTPEDGCKVQQPKRCDILSHQDDDKSPNKSLYNLNFYFYFSIKNYVSVSNKYIKRQ